ncbi:MAG: FumA C-terminus/TtdB family hydratase beta subunit [Syntrophomonadaceae bacterium]|nr:FumA C-terminus/TtdB family hydratase beta subunit [Bacillota bacterium]NLM88698.1 TRZ/ATZ family protein [Syntrophomonadaceae bacterium]HAA09014.1 TRZ/ATZ family protein [Syntrophomonas sp.]HQA49124.1 FumA C-terminus/TtdB family hydratase beta subunit [Syntrophomonadaceae bacterium]HQD89505.1 FumA C-terminus/TtdB family hydratase beta subunit [Syntrophomonadaceae bacterium]
MAHVLRAPLNGNALQQLHAGDEVLVQGTVYAARDAAHQKMIAALEAGQPLPFDIEGQIIYYVGPCPAPPGRIIGSAGPTTSSRMDVYTPALLQRGLKAMIGKGDRSQEVKEAMKKHGAVYLAAVGGAGVYLAHRITAVETIAYPELGPEALLKMEFQDFPCIVAIDMRGQSVYQASDE